MADPYGRDRTFTGPTSVGMGPVTDQEIQLMNTMTQDRKAQLEQRAYQSYIEAMDNLRKAEEQGYFPSMSGVADAQNRLNMVRGGMLPLEDSEPLYTYEIDGRPVSMTQQEMINAVQSGQITPSQAATMATGVPAPTPPMGSGSTTDAEMRAYQDAIGLDGRMGSGSTTDAEMRAYQGALGNLPSEVNDVDSFLRNLNAKIGSGSTADAEMKAYQNAIRGVQ